MLEKLEAILDAATIEDAWLLHQSYMAEYGFDRLIYGYTRFRTAHSFGDPQDLLVLSNHSQEYLEEFVHNGMYFHAPMVRWAMENNGACSWSWMEKTAMQGGLTDQEMRVIGFNQKMGVTAGYTISFRSDSSRSKGAIALTAGPGVTQAEVDALWEEKGQEISVLNNVAHLKLITLPHTGNRPALTKRQREVLEWVGEGKTMQDIAQIMGLTPATVEKHLRLAREALNVETTAQAVLKASFSNQIFVIEI
ncbi:Transcriptional activator protein LuxR [Pseudoruegeria aquimaris]|uniref:Transcriptional activator protein LuxR n=1 Tax=Pseudoruegeria aquimaris TaxID=393663 RepID=A0A1Y5RI36_9RHOB|nr:LuxR family transcriptional regulator [Pseudoruegeria aquimaris]SLN18031.1 Transcriptional activator protein LuxR [Pseudoruegeria aquimaris]